LALSEGIDDVQIGFDPGDVRIVRDPLIRRRPESVVRRVVETYGRSKSNADPGAAMTQRDLNSRGNAGWQWWARIGGGPPPSAGPHIPAIISDMNWFFQRSSASFIRLSSSRSCWSYVPAIELLELVRKLLDFRRDEVLDGSRQGAVCKLGPLVLLVGLECHQRTLAVDCAS